MESQWRAFADELGRNNNPPATNPAVSSHDQLMRNPLSVYSTDNDNREATRSAILRPVTAQVLSSDQTNAPNVYTQREVECDLEDMLELVNFSHDSAVTAMRNNDRSAHRAWNIARELTYFSGPGRTAYRFTKPGFRRGVKATATAALDDEKSPEDAKAVIDHALGVLDDLQPREYSEQEWKKLEEGYRESSYGLGSLKQDLMEILLNPNAIDQTHAVTLLEKAEHLLAAVASPQLKLYCLSLAMNIKPGRAFVLQPSGILADFIDQLREQQRTDGALDSRFIDASNEDVIDLTNASDQDEDDVEVIKGFLTKLVPFDSPAAAESWLHRTRRQSDVIDDDIAWICDNKPQCLQRLFAAFFSKKKGKAQKKWDEHLGHIEKQVAHKIASAISHMLVEYIIKYHLEGDNLLGHLFKGNSADESLKACKRFRLVEQALLEEKTVCLDLFKAPTAQTCIKVLAQPLKYVKDKKDNENNNARRAEITKTLKSQKSQRSSTAPEDSSTPPTAEVTPPPAGVAGSERKTKKGPEGSATSSTKRTRAKKAGANALVAVAAPTTSTDQIPSLTSDHERSSRADFEPQSQFQPHTNTSGEGANPLGDLSNNNAPEFHRSPLPATSFPQARTNSTIKRAHEQDDDERVYMGSSAPKRPRTTLSTAPSGPQNNNDLPYAQNSQHNYLHLFRTSAQPPQPETLPTQGLNQHITQPYNFNGQPQQNEQPLSNLSHLTNEEIWRDFLASAAQPTNSINSTDNAKGIRAVENADLFGVGSQFHNTVDLPGENVPSGEYFGVAVPGDQDELLNFDEDDFSSLDSSAALPSGQAPLSEFNEADFASGPDSSVDNVQAMSGAQEGQGDVGNFNHGNEQFVWPPLDDSFGGAQ
ncbi:hypothetical protein CLAFUW4_12578 [Fulvia fulva]|uniref:Uncharacterized protein n=1 Tax=Passalora fulva TaxID=5499 RepID=A0A9Q8PDZ8_PASFU|nr:uncharacterized protein CLAFUR5_11603 [Fulvia fulva]KAK4618148.1 hypothetical protein CLAFUR4_12583 [Fulvia fulva]KAK4619233.1 hypothetical protein CLAFUR0_12594 [Fulvia fulva]UJO20704.1 hypothetical protein CLAFUR5_11603 [Fulvia fulva]WPV18579.1 hypothetical protein CLAFUW4_12578 [Fulvia fulva]WPV33058.1 hypothetical protein CLAFUW7_12585 [Fulvia fulva]